MTELPACNNCGGEEWKKIYLFSPEREDPKDRSETRYACEDCDKEGRLFDGPGSIVLSGAFR